MADVPLMNNPMTTAGDAIYGGASGAPTRLAIGTAGQVLTVNAGATAPEWATGGGGSATNLASARYVRTAGSYTITGAGSDSFANVDGTNLSLAITTGARRVLIVVSATGTVNNAAGYIALDVSVDGTRLGAAGDGLVAVSQTPTASDALNLSFSHVTDVLTAASHTFNLMWRQGTTAHTSTLYGTTGVPLLSFSVVELYAG
jgi:hypothetical protein